jgi:hypothetical protein
VKTFFDGLFIDREKLEEAGIKYPIKLEYFKTSREENVETKFGIEVVKTEYLSDSVRVETKHVKNVTNNTEKLDKILALLRNNEVTPIGVEDVLQDLVIN